MKNNLLTLMLVLSSSLFLVNCSKGSSSSPDTPVVTTGSCATAGYVYTTQGCLPQSTACGTNFGYLNGSCYPAASTATVTGTATACLATDTVNTQIGVLTVGVCQPYCAQYGRKYGYSNNSCYPAN